MTPTQLRADSAAARRGSVKLACADLRISDAAVSLHVASLRKELGDQLFVRTSSGLAFTPGGLRLATHAVEMLGLADRPIHEVSKARGRPAAPAGGRVQPVRGACRARSHRALHQQG